MYMHVSCIANVGYMYLGMHRRRRQMARAALPAIMYACIMYSKCRIFIYLGTHQRHRQRARAALHAIM